MVSIGNFERGLAKYIGISGPALDQRDRELRKAGLILKTESGVIPRGKRAIAVNASDAAYVILAAASDSGPKDVVERVVALANMRAELLQLDHNGLFQSHSVPAGFQTLHDFLTSAILGTDGCYIERAIIRPHSLSAEIDASIGEMGAPQNDLFEFAGEPSQSGLGVDPEDCMQKVIELRSGFFQIVQCLIQDLDLDTQRRRLDKRGVPIPDNV